LRLRFGGMLSSAATNINSAGMDRWDDFLLQEAVPLVETKFGFGGNGRRGCFGKSSGGYGTMVHAMLHPDFWSAAASHSGDVGFELLFIPDFPKVLRALATTDNSIQAWLDKFFAAQKVKDPDVHILMILAMAATYDPDPTAYLGVRLPVTIDTCELIPERWANYVKWDPLTLVEEHGEGLKKLKALYIDCGDIDQFNLVYGSRRMHKRLTEMKVTHTYEEFPDDHTAVDYRMDVSHSSPRRLRDRLEAPEHDDLRREPINPPGGRLARVRYALAAKFRSAAK
jgi:putative esterase